MGDVVYLGYTFVPTFPFMDYLWLHLVTHGYLPFGCRWWELSPRYGQLVEPSLHYIRDAGWILIPFPVTNFTGLSNSCLAAFTLVVLRLRLLPRLR